MRGYHREYWLRKDPSVGNRYIPLINQVNVHEITLNTEVDKNGDLVDKLIVLQIGLKKSGKVQGIYH